MIDPISIGMALANFAPSLIKLFTGSDKAEQVAASVVDIAKTVTGTDTGEAALETLKSNPDKVLEFRQAVAAQQADLEKAYLHDRQDARRRDVELHQSGHGNTRADLMVFAVTVGLIACLFVLIHYKESIPGEVVGILSTIAGIFGACLKDAFAFEFGSSRGSKNKDEAITNMTFRAKL